MKTIIISPKDRTIGLETFQGGYQIMLGVLYLAAAVRNMGFDIDVVVCDSNEIVDIIKECLPDIVAVSCVTSTYPIARDIINKVKEYKPEIITVMGGHHATFMYEEIFRECKIDFICRGEGDEVLPKLLTKLAEGERYPDIPGMVYRKNGSLYNYDTINILDSLDNLPLITPDLLPPHLKFNPKIITSRGCPYRCAFCSVSAFYKGKWRQRSVEAVLRDLEYYVSQGYRKFWFHDDNFTVDTQWVRKFCENIKTNDFPKISWYCMTRVDTICKEPELLELMSSAGCKLLSIGLESGVQRVLDRFKKKISLEEVRKAIKHLNHSSIFHNWYLIIGSGDEYDTKEYLEKSLAFTASIPFDLIIVSLLTPFPGTPIYEKLVSENRLLHKNWELYDATHCVYKPAGMTNTEMEAFISKAYHRLYLFRGLKNLFIAYKGWKIGIFKLTMLKNICSVFYQVFCKRRSVYEVMKNMHSVKE